MENRFMRLIDGIIRFRWFIVALMVVLTALSVYLMKDLKINNDYETWLPVNDRVGDLLRQIDREFSSNTLLLVVFDFGHAGAFTPDALRFMDRITKEVQGIEGLFQVTSITNVLDIRKTEDGVEAANLIREIPRNMMEGQALRDYVLSDEMYRGSIVSADGRYTVLAATVDSGHDEIQVAGKIIGRVDELSGAIPYYIGGDMSIAYYMDHYMKRDLTVLVPIIFVLIVALLSYGLRSASGVVACLTVIGLSIVWMVGMKSVLGFPFNIISPAVLVLMMAMASDYAVHIYNRYQQTGDIRTSSAQIATPVIMSALTTIAGLGTFGVTKIIVLRNFGIELAFGLAFACILSFLLITLCGYFEGASKKTTVQKESALEHRIDAVMHRLGGWIHDHARAYLAGAVVFLVVFAYGITRINTSVDFVEWMPKDSQPRRSSVILENDFNGMYRVSMFFQGDMEDPRNMAAMGSLGNYLRSDHRLDGFMSISDLIAEENWLMNGVYAVPETREGIANLWFLLEGQDILKTFVSEDRKQALINCLMNDHETRVMKEISAEIQQYLDANVSGELVSVDPLKLTDSARKTLDRVMVRKASRELAWLAVRYDEPRTYAPGIFEETVRKGLHADAGDIDMGPIWRETGNYLENEAVEELPPGLIASLVEGLRESWGSRFLDETKGRLAGLITQGRAMNAEDARTTVDGMIGRAEHAFRLQKASHASSSIFAGLDSALANNEDFVKRSGGVLWSLFSPRPVFFMNEVKDIAGINGAITETSQVQIDQSGSHEMFGRFDKLLYESQIQSFVLAATIVLIMISLSERSLRRGLLALITIMIPLGMVMGFMGWVGIPLDFGTVLCGSLIIGLGVDAAIHFMAYYRRLYISGLGVRECLEATTSHVGRAVITANGTTLLGFIVLIFSQTTELRNFAIINAMAITMVTASVLSVLPAMASLVHLEDRAWKIDLDVAEHHIVEEIARRYE
ncbi:MAG TPA: MMPL family transporter [Deltaproteobacteria bacterium]|nr:MMPL family transporter [Deltaproteobacteria bacterium]HPR56093.1 MMPL family transporter [Deltaproteobacteria bacterium]